MSAESTPPRPPVARPPDSPAAISRWDGEGGAVELPAVDPTVTPELTEAALVQLRVRVVALENLVITLLAQGSQRQLDLAREMAAYICPRPGFTDHPLTTHAAAQMNHLVERALHFRATPLP